MADESILWPESDGGDTSDPSAEFNEAQYDPLETVHGSHDKATTVALKNDVFGVVTSESFEGEDSNDKTGFVKIDLYDSGLDKAATATDVEAFAGAFYRTLVNNDVVSLGRDAEGQYYIKNLAKVCLFKITEIIGNQSYKYKAKKYLLWIDENNTTLTNPPTTLTLQDNTFLIYDYQKGTHVVGETCFGLRSGVRWEDETEKSKQGIIVPLSANTGTGVMVRITSAATQGGVYNGVVLLSPAIDIPAGSNLATTDLGGTIGPSIIIMNVKEEGAVGTHDLTDDPSNTDLDCIGVYRSTNSDGTAVYAIDKIWVGCTDTSDIDDGGP